MATHLPRLLSKAVLYTDTTRWLSHTTLVLYFCPSICIYWHRLAVQLYYVYYILVHLRASLEPVLRTNTTNYFGSTDLLIPDISPPTSDQHLGSAACGSSDASDPRTTPTYYICQILVVGGLLGGFLTISAGSPWRSPHVATSLTSAVRGKWLHPVPSSAVLVFRRGNELRTGWTRPERRKARARLLW
jgi:hypothetical protein